MRRSAIALSDRAPLLPSQQVRSIPEGLDVFQAMLGGDEKSTTGIICAGTCCAVTSCLAVE